MFLETASLLSFVKTLEGSDAALPSPIKPPAGPSSTSSPKDSKKNEGTVGAENGARSSKGSSSGREKIEKDGSNGAGLKADAPAVENGGSTTEPVPSRDEEMPGSEGTDA